MRVYALLIGLSALAAFTSRQFACGPRNVDYAAAREVVNRRCVECHSAQPVNKAFPIAPQGVVLDTPAQMKRYARRIEVRAALERTMPLANLSGMTDDERRVLARWVETGANIPQ